MDAQDLLRFYFTSSEIKPDVEEPGMVLDYFENMESMPPYFTFEMREAFEPKQIADKVNQLFEKDEDKEAWLKELYDRSDVLKQIWEDAATKSTYMPFVGIVSKPQSYKDMDGNFVDENKMSICCRSFITRMHRAYPIAASIATAAASRVPGTVAYECVCPGDQKKI